MSKAQATFHTLLGRDEMLAAKKCVSDKNSLCVTRNSVSKNAREKEMDSKAKRLNSNVQGE